MKKQFLAILLSMVLAITFAFAIDPSGAVVTDGSEYGPISGPSAGTTDVTAGKIKEANLETNQSTVRWAGLTGNVSGNIQLGDGASSDVMYTWTAKGNIVYVSEQATPTWASLTGATTSDIESSYSHLAGSTADNVTETFNGATATDIGSNIFADFSVGAARATTVAGWITYALTDTSDIIFAGIVDDKANFRGDTADYEMIVPENGLDGDSTATTYNIWVELI